MPLGLNSGVIIAIGIVLVAGYVFLVHQPDRPDPMPPDVEAANYVRAKGSLKKRWFNKNMHGSYVSAYDPTARANDVLMKDGIAGGNVYTRVLSRQTNDGGGAMIDLATPVKNPKVLEA